MRSSISSIRESDWGEGVGAGVGGGVAAPEALLVVDLPNSVENSDLEDCSEPELESLAGGGVAAPVRQDGRMLSKTPKDSYSQLIRYFRKVADNIL